MDEATPLLDEMNMETPELMAFGCCVQESGAGGEGVRRTLHRLRIVELAECFASCPSVPCF